MNLPALYDLLAARTNPDGSIRLPIWSEIAKTAEVDPLEDTYALRALIEKGAIDRVTIPNSYGDCEYVLRRPAQGLRDAFYTRLRTIGATVHHFRA